MALTIQLFTQTSASAQHPTTTLTVPSGYKILGGGAFDHYSEPGNLLTASYPLSPTQWFVAGKDHESASPATITAYAFGLLDPNNEWDVVVDSNTSLKLPHPEAIARLRAGYVMTGGGAFVNYSGAGNLLTASYPDSESSWRARSKDHDTPDPSQITAYVIGIKHNQLLHRAQHSITNATGASASHPTAQVQVAAGYTLCGGGAIDNYTGDGNLLTASYPNGSLWMAAGKDHEHPDPSSITAYAIGIQQL
jgi:vibriolysin